MGGGGGKGGSKAPQMPEVVAAPQPVQMPEVPAVAPAPTIPEIPETPVLAETNDDTVQAEMKRLEEEEAKRRRLMAGRQSTILTDPLETWDEEEKSTPQNGLLKSDDTSNTKVSTLKKTDTLGG